MKDITFEKAIEIILSHEGGYKDDPADLGGETNWGISKKSFPNLDIKSLTRDRAIKIYQRDYWDRYKIETYPDSIRLAMFDMVVNAGPIIAGKILQRSLNRFYYNLTVDGRVGAKTMAALKEVTNEAKEASALPYFVCIERMIHHSNTAANIPKQLRFLKGWITRSDAILNEGLKP